MRDIKFRAWDKRTNKIYETELDFYGFSVFGECTLLCPPRGDDLQYLILEQYTGLKDKNGREIYEGDILLANCAPSGHPKKNKQHKVIMEWCLREWDVVIIDYEIGSKWRTSYMEWGYEGNALEVIGNIHENPELLNA